MTPLPKDAPRVLFPQEFTQDEPQGPLYGYYHPETKVANVLSCGAPPSRPRTFAPPRLLGHLGPKEEGSPQEKTQGETPSGEPAAHTRLPRG